MGVWQGSAVSIGAVLGTGVIALPALAAQIAGPASLVAWLALVALSAPLAATFAALGARYPDAGGVSTYVRRAFGRQPAAMVGWWFYLAIPVGAPPAALFGGAYVAAALGGGSRTTYLTAALLILAVTAANAFGVYVSGRVQLGLAALLVVLLVAATIVALPHARLANLTPFAPHGWFAVGSAAAVLVWGFAGWEAVTHLAADFQNPARQLPRSTAIAGVVVGVLYLAVAATSVLVLGTATGSSEAPLAELLEIGVGGPVKLVTAAVAVLLTLGTMNAFFAGAAKLGSALGRDGAFPRWFAHGSQAGDVPRRSLAVIAVLGMAILGVVALTGSSTKVLVLLTTGSFVFVYIFGTAAAIRLLPKRSWSRRAAVVAFVCVTGLLVLTGWYVLWAVGVALAALAYDRFAHRRATARARAPVADLTLPR
jgi:amino acid efflux transporter